jgi:DNA-binding YbaB/EbfC family protein
MIPDMKGLMKQMREMQSRIEELQSQFQQQEFVGTAGGGVVTATLSGGHEVRRIKIDPKVVDPSDVEMLEDLIAAALNDARTKIEERRKDEMGKITGGLNIPGLT